MHLQKPEVVTEDILMLTYVQIDVSTMQRLNIVKDKILQCSVVLTNWMIGQHLQDLGIIWLPLWRHYFYFPNSLCINLYIWQCKGDNNTN